MILVSCRTAALSLYYICAKRTNSTYIQLDAGVQVSVSDWREGLAARDVWKCITRATGEQSVMTISTTLMPASSATVLDSGWYWCFQNTVKQSNIIIAVTFDGIAQERAAKLLCVIFTGKKFWGSCSICGDCLLSACVLVKTVAKSEPSNTAVTCGLCGLDIVPYYLRTPNLGRAPHQAATWMLFLNELESLFFCDANYTMAELLDKAYARLSRLIQRPWTLSLSSFTRYYWQLFHRVETQKLLFSLSIV